MSHTIFFSFFFFLANLRLFNLNYNFSKFKSIEFGKHPGLPIKRSESTLTGADGLIPNFFCPCVLLALSKTLNPKFMHYQNTLHGSQTFQHHP